MERPIPLLSLRAISKHFGGVEALMDVDLDVHRGEVVALVGDNAAGKSTLARIVAGIHRPDSGTILIDGEPVTIPNAQAAFSHGIAPVFQELALPENLDVTSNIFLGREHSVRGLLDVDAMDDLARSYLNRLHSRIPDLRAPLYTLSAGQRQCVAIARTLVANPRLVVLDEPTASLSVSQTAEVLTYVDGLRDMGLGVILISHNLTDVRAVADRVEVLRHGRNNGSFSASEATYEEILAAITGATRSAPRR
ncbi:ATP-binding cassette domain-containing protein [Tessaracoccus antarcticus]|uniref:Sugar ABC transporter ATP-binding protein n=1 Tax=Tessaracoccus antarcticus TaxID=2479848 RepID=A0A3M0GC62_9ACTN|nr:ATP-binding cassette domain-containing protein [Tessaracoccus antarcticus]RMB62037.1 sugar ABC transporter ATP-binding protein [Tessaracoccus antarcticus]